jgi:YVTN family beta-propeller protein
VIVVTLIPSTKLCSIAILLVLWGKPSIAQTHSEAALITMPPVSSSGNLYSEAAAGKISPQVAGALPRVYVPNHASGSVTVIDPDTFRVVGSFAVGPGPQHVVPSWDLQTLWITNNGHRSRLGSVTPIDPRTGKPGQPLHVLDSYNMYFTADGTSSIVVDEALRRLDFRDPHTMKLQYSISTPSCHGINHGDFSSDGSFAIFTCEFSHSLIKIDLPERRVTDTITLPFLAAAAPIWAMSARMEASSGSPADLTMSFTASERTLEW